MVLAIGDFNRSKLIGMDEIDLLEFCNLGSKSSNLVKIYRRQLTQSRRKVVFKQSPESGMQDKNRESQIEILDYRNPNFLTHEKRFHLVRNFRVILFPTTSLREFAQFVELKPLF